MPEKLSPLERGIRPCAGSWGNGSIPCTTETVYRIRLMKGDEVYDVCGPHAEIMGRHERGKDWHEYAYNERK